MPITRRSLPVVLAAAGATLMLASCTTTRQDPGFPSPPLIRDWRSEQPLGHDAVADRRNLAPGGRLRFRQLLAEVLSLTLAGPGGLPAAELRLSAPGRQLERSVMAGEAFNWGDWHIAVVAIGRPGELGAGLVSLEIAELASLPPAVADSRVSGGADLRLRIPHEITHITLHHTGSAEPLRPEDDPAAKLRGLQSWGASDRNWWDVPYHLLLDLDGDVYEGRDWHYMGETNTTYDPRGHLLISVLGNYEIQEPTPAQLAAIADLMAWAVGRFHLPLERIGGHYNYATTGCPGRHLRRYLEDGTLRRMVESRMAGRPQGE